MQMTPATDPQGVAPSGFVIEAIGVNHAYEGQNGWVRALQNFEMLGAQKYVKNVYYHELARALRSFGYTIQNNARGDFEIAEISRAVCERFSKRHREIDEKTRAFLVLVRCMMFMVRASVCARVEDAD